jgi:hypothetical protein
MVKLCDLGELPLRIIFEMVSEVEFRVALDLRSKTLLLRPGAVRQDRDGSLEERQTYVLSSLLFQSVLRISEEFPQTSSKTHFTVLAQAGQHFVALLFRSVLTKWVCLLFLGPLYNPVLLFGPNTWLTYREQQALISFGATLDRPLSLTALAFNGIRSALPMLADLASSGPEEIRFYTPKNRLESVSLCFYWHRHTCWPLSKETVLRERG